MMLKEELKKLQQPQWPWSWQVTKKLVICKRKQLRGVLDEHLSQRHNAHFL